MASKEEIQDACRIHAMLQHEMKDPYNLGVILFTATAEEKEVVRRLCERAKEARSKKAA